MTMMIGVKRKVNQERISLIDKEEHYEDIIINPPATIVKWDDGTKTVVKCQNGDVYDAEKGIALCFMKKMFDNKSYYNEVIKEAIAVNEARQNKK